MKLCNLWNKGVKMQKNVINLLLSYNNKVIYYAKNSRAFEK